MIRTPEDLIAVYEAEQAEREAVQARQELIGLLSQPGWARFQRWLSGRRDSAFQQLRGIQGSSLVVAESFWKWQAIDSLYEDIEGFIKNSVDFGEDVLRRERSILEEQYLRENFNEQSGPQRAGRPTGSSADPSAGGTGPTADSY